MSVVMGTAGHIDHGKTSLVRALTGTDCDRLEEEKRRGITIELGFAHLDFPEGRRLSIVDVPGHEKFVKNMVAGATGIDFVLLVIAADEGVMPQTREHLEICSLLGLTTGLVAVTKIDMVDPELLDLALEDISATLKGTFLEGASVFPVSAHTGQGLPALRAALERLERDLAPQRMQDIFRLPVDRVFTLKGHGTVVTGTMISGSARVGDVVAVCPTDKTARVRSLQSHGESVDVALSGRRTAVNLHGLEVEDIERGQVLAHEGELIPSTIWDVRLTCLSSSPRPLRHRGELHIHHGTKEILGRIYLRDGDSLAPGHSGLAQLRFPEPLPAVFGDRVILRSFSPLRTVAGGVALRPLGLTLTRRSPVFTRSMELLGSLPIAPGVDDEALILAQIELAGREGARFAALRLLTGLEGKKLDKILGVLGGRRQVFCFDRDEKIYVAPAVLEALGTSCLEFIAAFHKANTLRKGVSRGALASGWGKALSPKLTHFLVERLVRDGALEADGDAVRLPGHGVTLGAGQKDIHAALKDLYAKAGITPPTIKEALEALGVAPKELDPVLRLLVKDGDLVRVEEGLYYARETLEDLRGKVRDWFSGHEDLDPASFRDLTGLSRKFAIPLLEYFDAARLTVRVGNRRILRVS